MDMHTLTGNRSIQNAAALVLMLLALFLASKVVSEFLGYQYIGAGVQPTNTISVQGEGSVVARPDIARFSFSVVEERPTVGDAQARATEKINAAIAYLEDNDVAENDIKTTGYNVYPRYDYIQQACREGFCPPGQQRLRGFEVRQSVEVTARDLDTVGTLLSGLGEQGVSEMSSLMLTVEDDEAVKADAREEAIDQAREKAEVLAKSLGVDLVRIVSFHESTPGYPVYNRGYAQDGLGGADVAMESAPQIPTGENEITSNVSITYEIR